MRNQLVDRRGLEMVSKRSAPPELQLRTELIAFDSGYCFVSKPAFAAVLGDSDLNTSSLTLHEPPNVLLLLSSMVRDVATFTRSVSSSLWL